MEYVKTSIEKGLAIIEFFHPSHNSLPSNLLKDLVKEIDSVGKNDKVKVVLLKSGGERTFCAGASFDELVSIDDFDTGKDFFMGFARVINAMRKCPKIIIGRVQGKSVGGGVGLASAVDFCFATQYSSVKLSELAIGIGPFVVGPAVERKVGKSAFMQMAINARQWYPASWAEDKGLFANVSEDIKDMDEAIDLLVEDLLNTSVDAMKAMKKVFWEDYSNWDELLEKRAEYSGSLVLSEFTKESLSKYKK